VCSRAKRGSEDFVENADLAEFDLSSMKPVKFELSAKDT
jgi:hypothetical protein